MSDEYSVKAILSARDDGLSSALDRIDRSLKNLEGIVGRIEQTVRSFSSSADNAFNKVGQSANSLNKKVNQTGDELSRLDDRVELNKATNQFEKASRSVNDLGTQANETGRDLGAIDDKANLSKVNRQSTDLRQDLGKLGTQANETGRDLGTIDDKANLSKASTSTNQLKRDVNALGKESLETSREVGTIDDKANFSSANSSLRRMSSSVDELGRNSEQSSRKMTSLSNESKRTSSSLRSIDGSSLKSVDNSADKVTSSLQRADTKAKRFHSSLNSVNNTGTTFGGRFDKATSAVSKGFDRASKQAGSFSKHVASTVVGVGIMNSLSAATNVLQNSIEGAVKRYDKMKQFPKVLQMLGASTGDAKKATDRLMKGLEGIPVSVDQVTGAVQSLVTNGMSLQDATDTALGLAHALVASGASADETNRAMVQYQQVMAKGKPELEDWRTLQETMAPALKKVAQEMLGTKATTNDLYEALKEGDVTVNDLNEAFMKLDKGQKGFAQQALKSSAGISSAFNVIQSRLNILGATAIEKFDAIIAKTTKFSNTSQLLMGVAEKISFLNKQFKSLSTEQLIQGLQLAGNAFKAFAGVLVAFQATNVIAKISTSFAGFHQRLNNVTGYIQQGVYLVQLRDKLTLFGTKVTSVGNVFKNGFAKILNTEKFAGLNQSLINTRNRISMIGEGFKQEHPHVVNAIGMMNNGVKMALSKTTQIINNTMAGAVKVFNVSLQALKPVLIVATLLAGFGVAYGEFGTEIDKFINLAIKKGPQIVRSLSQGIQSKLPDLIKKGADMIVKVVDGIVANLPTIMKEATNIISTLVRGLNSQMPKLVSSAGKIIVTLAKGIINNLPQIARTGLSAITTFISEVTKNLPSIIKEGSSILMSLVKGITHLLPEMAVKAIAAVSKFIEGIVDNLPQIAKSGWEIIKALVKGIVEAIPKVLKTAVNAVKKIFDKLFGDEKDGADKTGKSVSKSQKKMTDDIAKETSKAKNEASKNSSEAYKKVSDNYKGMSDASLQSVQAMTQGVNLSSKSQTETVAKNAKTMTQSVTNSYQTMSKNLSQVSSDTVKSLNNMNKSYANLTESAIKSLNKMRETISKAMNSIASSMNKATSSVDKSSKSIVKTITTPFNDLEKKMETIGANITIGLNNGIVSKEKVVMNNVDKMADNIEKRFKKAMDIHSPSRKMAVLGRFVAEGVSVGISDNADKPAQAVRSMAQNLVDAWNPNINTEVGIQSGGNKLMLNGSPTLIQMSLGGLDFDRFSFRVGESNNARLKIQKRFG